MEVSAVYDQLNVNWTGMVNGLGQSRKKKEKKTREDFTKKSKWIKRIDGGYIIIWSFVGNLLILLIATWPASVFP